MKVIVQIPCFNEEGTLRQTVADIPRQLAGVDRVEILVVDDGSTDGTAEVARAAGVDHVVRHTARQGLARAFRSGVDACLRLGADVIVNTDGDNQYEGRDIGRLIAPVLAGEADITVGDRRAGGLRHFSLAKRLLQRVGSRVVRRLAGTAVPDAVSGFRAMTRAAALKLNVLSPFSYTIEMLIQAGRQGLAVRSVPIDTHPVARASRLAPSSAAFVRQSLVTMVRVYTMYHPFRVFAYIGLLLGLGGAVPVGRFLWLYANHHGAGHVQSLILGGVLVVIGFMTFLVGLLADVLSFNRQLIEMTLERTRRIELALGSLPEARRPDDAPGPAPDAQGAATPR